MQTRNIISSKTNTFAITDAELLRWKTINRKINKQKDEKHGDSVRDTKATMKRTNVHVIELSEEKEKYNGTNATLEWIMAMDFPELIKDINPKIQEALKIQRRINKNESIPMQSIVKLLTTTAREIVKAARKTRKTPLPSKMQQ